MMCSIRNRYPQLEVDLDKLRENLAALKERCQAFSIEIAGVVKGFNALPEPVRVFDEAGFSYLASSRLEQLRRMKRYGVSTPLMLIRIPMLSELEEVVSLTELSLHSDLEVLRALDREAARQNRRHKVVLMADLGDLREGFWPREELVAAAVEVERSMPCLELAGVGTNLGCYGTVLATPAKMEELLASARAIEAAIGRKLEIVSGGASTSVHMLLDNSMPVGITQLRLGECLALGGVLGDNFDFMHRDVFTLRAEVVECRDKPSYPIGELTRTAFDQTPHFTDRGIRRRALLGMGRVDYGDPAELLPRMPGVELLGASSDHTILDVEGAKDQIRVGDVLEFDLTYATMASTPGAVGVQVVYREPGGLFEPAPPVQGPYP